MSAWLEGGFIHRDPLVDAQDTEADQELLGGHDERDTSPETLVVRDTELEIAGQLVLGAECWDHHEEAA